MGGPSSLRGSPGASGHQPASNWGSQVPPGVTCLRVRLALAWTLPNHHHSPQVLLAPAEPKHECPCPGPGDPGDPATRERGRVGAGGQGWRTGPCAGGTASGGSQGNEEPTTQMRCGARGVSLKQEGALFPGTWSRGGGGGRVSGARHPAGGGPKPDPRPRGRAPTLAGPGGLAPRVRDASHRDAAAVSQSRRKFPDSCPHHAAPLCGRRSSSGNKALQTVTGAGAPLPARAPQAVKSTVKSRAASEPGAPAAAHRGVGPRLPPPPARGRSTWTPSRSWPAGPQVWEGVASRRRSLPRGGSAPPRGGPAPPRGHALPPGPPWSRARPRPPKPRPEARAGRRSLPANWQGMPVIETR